MNILLIDDDEASNVYTEIILKKSGELSTIKICKNGEEGLAYLKENDKQSIDLILLDINMPIMNGHEFLQHYNLIEKDPISIVMLSTSVLETDRSEALEYDCVKGFINKPLSVDKIKEYLS